MIVADICGIILKPVETARRIIQLDRALPSHGYDEYFKQAHTYEVVSVFENIQL